MHSLRANQGIFCQGENWSRCEFIISGLSHRKIGSSQKMMNYDILYSKIRVYPVGGSGPGRGMHFRVTTQNIGLPSKIDEFWHTTCPQVKVWIGQGVNWSRCELVKVWIYYFRVVTQNNRFQSKNDELWHTILQNRGLPCGQVGSWAGYAFQGHHPKYWFANKNWWILTYYMAKSGSTPWAGWVLRGPHVLWGRGSRAVKGVSHQPAKLL